MSLQSLQLGYDKVEDRIVLLVQEGEGRQALLLTRKLCFALIEALGDIIHQGGVPQGLRAAPAAQQAELMSMKHARAISQVKADQAGKAAPSVPQAPLSTRLVRQIDINGGGAERRTLLMSDAAGAAAKLSLDTAQLHWLVERLVAHCTTAGWGASVPVPQWLDETAMAELARSQSVSARVH